MSFEERKALIRRFVAAFNDGQLGIIDEAIDRDFFNYAPAAGEETAQDILRDLAGGLRAAMPDLTINVANFVDEGETVSFDLTLRGTQTGDLWGAPAQNKLAEWTSTVTARFAGGKFAFAWRELPVPSILAALRQIGLVPPPEDMDKPPKYPVSLPEFLLKLVFTGQAGDKECSHLEQIQVVEPTGDVCRQCVATGDVWPALRMCLICGYVGCCDTSKHKHMKQHYEETGHPIFRSIRLQESWVWCYEDNAFFSGKILEKYRPSA
jgi:predicted ester cyclase